MSVNSDIKIYGIDTYPSIQSSSKLLLNGTTVTGTIYAENRIKAVETKASSIYAKANASLINTICKVRVKARGNIDAVNLTSKFVLARLNLTLINSKISDSIYTGQKLLAHHCELLGNVEADSAIIEECQSIKSISAKNVNLRFSRVIGDVTAGVDPSIINSKIYGTLKCSANYLIIEGSNINTIEIEDLPPPKKEQAAAPANNNAIEMPIPNVNTGTLSLQSLAEEEHRIYQQSISEKLITLVLVNSVVNNVIFKNKKGLVVVSNTSKVTDQIIGGQSRPLDAKR